MKKLFLLLTVSIFLLSPSASNASHIAGAEISYEHLSGNQFRFHFKFYRDCSGITPLQSQGIELISSCGDTMGWSCGLDSTVKINQLCATEVDRCTNISSPYTGIEAYYYHHDVTLPSNCNLWTINVINGICNRNENFAITNLIPDTFCLYVQSKLNNADAPINSSPVFTAPPLFQLCGDTQYLHFYAQDPDGDSLTFELYTPHSNQIEDVQYIAGCSATQPVTFALPADSTVFDPTTGDLRFKANGPQITVIGVRVNEFRNGIFIGSVEHDLKLIFNNCISNTPIATGLNGTQNFTAHVCADSLLAFEILGNDIDMDSIYFSWQNNIPGSNITLSGINNQIATFHWQPVDSNISQNPYTFTLYLTDSVCPYVNYNSYQYTIYVDSCFTTPAASFTSPQNICEGSCISFTNLSMNATAYQWYFPGATPDTSTLANPSGICYPASGIYDVQLIAGNSSGSDTLLLTNHITVFAPQVQSIIQIDDTLFAIPGADSYQWYFDTTAITGATDYFYLATANGNYSVVAIDSNGCESSADLNGVFVGVNQLAISSWQLAIVPNPVSDKIKIQKRRPERSEGSEIKSGTAVEISIYNVLGEKVAALQSSKLEEETGIDVSALPTGMYYFEISSDKKIYRAKFLKQ